MRRQKRSVRVIFLAILVLITALGLAVFGLSSSISYFYSPSELRAANLKSGVSIRLGGLVMPGSLKRKGVTVQFIIGDGVDQYRVVFQGVLPALFREGAGAIAEGRLSQDNLFVANNILAKHDERYAPHELLSGDNSSP